MKARPQKVPIGTLDNDEREIMRHVSALLKQCQECTGTLEHNAVSGAFDMICDRLRCEQTDKELNAERMAFFGGLQ